MTKLSGLQTASSNPKLHLRSCSNILQSALNVHAKWIRGCELDHNPTIICDSYPGISSLDTWLLPDNAVEASSTLSISFFVY